MNDLLADALVEALRPIVAELVAEEVERRSNLHSRPTDEEPPYLTVAQYAERHHTTPAAVRARIRRGKLAEAFKPPGAHEYLIPRTGQQPGGHDD